MKIVEYTIVRCVQTCTFDAEINALIEKGWQPYGPPSTYDEMNTLYQAMVLYEKPKLWWEGTPTNSRGPG